MNKINIYKKISILLIVFAAILLIPNSKVKAFDLTAQPTGICVTYYDEIDSRGFAWQTSTSVTETHLLISQNAHVDWSTVTPIMGTYEDIHDFRCHKAQVEDLEPGRYFYKVGSPNAYSEIGTFTIDNSNDDKLTFSYVTDSQDSSKDGFDTYFASTLESVAEFDPNFIVFAGDLVDNSHADWDRDPSLIKMEEWSYAFDCNKEVIMNYPFMSASGNHEAAGDTFVSHSNIKYDGSNSTGGYYSFDYENLHFIVLDTNVLVRSDQTKIDAQLNWLKADLAATTKTWKVVMLHHGPYSTGDHTNDGELLFVRDTLPQIFAEYKVDLVLQGHDHVYSRTLPYLYGTNADGELENGRLVNINEKLVEEDGILWSMEPDGTYYITINSCGQKYYPPKDYDTSRIFPAKSPVNGKLMSQEVRQRMFANIEIDGNSLLLKSYISKDDGSEELYDYIAIKKNTYQDVIDAIDELPETVTIENSFDLKTAYDLYTGLSDRALKYVPQASVDKLNGLLETYDLEDAVAAYTAILAIAKLDTDVYDEEFWINYQEANDLYYNLNATQMEMVYNHEILAELKINLEEYRENTISKYLVESVQELIDSIESQPNKEKARLIAKMAYEALSDELKALVKNTEILNKSFVPEVEEPASNSTEEGCGGAIAGSITAILVLGLGVLMFRRKRGDFDE